MLLGCYQLLCRPRQFQLKLHTEARRRRVMGMTWPKQLSCSQQWIKLGVYWVTQDVCSCLITTQCLLHSILYLGGKKYLFISHHFQSMGFLYVAMETCHFFSLHRTHSHTSKNGIHMNKHLIPKPTYKISIWCLSPVRKNYIRFCLCKSLVFPEVIHFSLPPEAHGPKGWDISPDTQHLL